MICGVWWLFAEYNLIWLVIAVGWLCGFFSGYTDRTRRMHREAYSVEVIAHLLYQFGTIVPMAECRCNA